MCMTFCTFYLAVIKNNGQTIQWEYRTYFCFFPRNFKCTAGLLSFVAAQAAQAAGIKVNFFCINGLNAYTFLFIIYSLQYCLSQIRIRIRSKGFQIRFTGSSIYCMDKKYRLLSIYSSYIYLQNSEVLQVLVDYLHCLAAWIHSSSTCPT